MHFGKQVLLSQKELASNALLVQLGRLLGGGQNNGCMQFVRD
jgi:hypothetical protein